MLNKLNGWQRLWLLLTILWLGTVGYLAYPNWPGTDTGRVAGCYIPYEMFSLSAPSIINEELRAWGQELPAQSNAKTAEIVSDREMGELISKFNKEMDKQGKLKIDESLVAIRDALAHGRVSASAPDETLRLLKFDKPQDGRVRVAFNEELSEEWFMRYKSRVRDALDIATQMI